MRKILFIFLILLLSHVCFAGRVQQAQKAVIAAKNGAGGDACGGGSQSNSNIMPTDDGSETFCRTDCTLGAMGQLYSNLSGELISMTIESDSVGSATSADAAIYYNNAGTWTLLATSNTLSNPSSGLITITFPSGICLTSGVQYLVFMTGNATNVSRMDINTLSSGTGGYYILGSDLPASGWDTTETVYQITGVKQTTIYVTTEANI